MYDPLVNTTRKRLKIYFTKNLSGTCKLREFDHAKDFINLVY